MRTHTLSGSGVPVPNVSGGSVLPVNNGGGGNGTVTPVTNGGGGTVSQ